MKQRYSSLDISIIAHELSATLTSLRLANIYDLSTRIFLFKFAAPNRREQLLVDSGFRAHLTSFSRSTAAAPSAFVARLRKFLRTRRVTAVRQVGTDRVIEIVFGDGLYRLFLEFYAGGNVVLCDAELTMLAVLRGVAEGEEHEQYRPGLKMDLSQRQNFEGVPELTVGRLKEGLERAVERQGAAGQKKGKVKQGDKLRKALAVTTTEFPPVLIEHALFVGGFEREALPEEVVGDEGALERLLGCLREASRVVEEIKSGEVARGYIVAKERPKREKETIGDGGEDGELLMYEDFHPFKPAHLAADGKLRFLEYEGFNKTVDEFFSSLEGQKLESRLQEREDTAKRRIESARSEQAKRIDGLQQVQELNIRKAQAIEANVERVEEAVAAINGLIAQGMDWDDIGRLVGNEQARGNAVALTIKLPLKLQENTVTMLLAEYDDVGDENDMADETESEASDSEDEAKPAKKSEDKRLTIDIDLALSPWSNARQYYDQRRTAQVKQEKTAQASQKALKSTEQKVMADLKKGLKQEKDVLRPVRKQFWFEKFIWFISSDGYLVLAGRDAQQNEMLYRRYLRKGDVYVHADLHGAASVIIKNHRAGMASAMAETPIPPSTLSQAGNLAVCTSSAWDSKAGMGAWWVNADQVSKTAPTGEYLTTGGFMVRGKKNFLPPAQLLLGFAVLFQISEESKARHVRHRLQEKDTMPETPDLTDGETIAESEMAGGTTGGSESDDEFPDAEAPGPAPGDAEIRGSESDDEFPDASHGNLRGSRTWDDDDFDDARRDADEDEDGGRAFRANPLQVNGAAGAKSETDAAVEEDDDADDGDIDEEPERTEASSATAHPNGLSSAQDSQAQSEAGDVPRKQTGKPAASQQAPPAKQVRGKKGKAKKAAAKYADQDEEDREMAMKLLGSKAAQEKRAAEATQTEAKKETTEEARARRRAQHERAQKEGLEAEEIRRLNLEEGVEELGEDEAAALTQLDALVGTPLPGDEILEAIPVCAPWASLSKFKYKAKMQPGQQKKGKAVREILGRWTKDAADAKKVDAKGADVERIWPREGELIRGFKEQEVVGILPVKSVRVMMSGGGWEGGWREGERWEGWTGWEGWEEEVEGLRVEDRRETVDAMYVTDLAVP